MKRLNIPYPIGLSVSKYERDKNYTITGNLAEKYRFRDFDGAYDFEEYIKKHVDSEGIQFDSEYCQFFAYAKSEKRAKKFAQDITDWFEKVKELIA